MVPKMQSKLCTEVLRSPQQQIHRPAPADVLSLAPAVQQHFFIRAARLFERIGEDRQPVEGAVVVDRMGTLIALDIPQDGRPVPPLTNRYNLNCGDERTRTRVPIYPHFADAMTPQARIKVRFCEEAAALDVHCTVRSQNSALDGR